MKILMVNKFLYPRGGAETYMLRIGEELTRRGHQVEYFGMYDEKNTVGNAEGLTTVNMDFHASGAEKLLYPFRIIYSGEARRKMRQVIDRFHPDIIHFNNINFQLTPSVILAGAEKNIPMVQTVHDLQMLCPNHMMMEFGTWKLCEECSGKKCKMACVRKKCIHGSRAKSLIGAIEGTIYTSSHVYDRVARYICPSRFIEEKLLTVPRYAGKTTMIHNFLSKTAEINAPKGDYVLYFGRLSEEKGIDRILAACRLLPDRNLDTILATANDDRSRTLLTRIVRGQCNLDGHASRPAVIGRKTYPPGRLVGTRIAVHNLRGPRLRRFESQPATRLIRLKSLIQLPGIGKFQISEIAATFLIATSGRQKSRRRTEQKFQFHLRLSFRIK
jgi:glycosyltransferase involved in cell wall biosynthesis